MADNENPVEAGQFLGDDGTFQDNWRELAFPGDEGGVLRADPTLAQIKDIRTMAKQVVSGESTIGKLSGGREFAILPNEQSTDDERGEFHTKCGRPASAEGYELDKVQVPEGIPKDEKFIAKMGQTLFEGGASKALAQQLVKGYMDYTVELTKSMETEDKLANAEANKQLHTVLGSAYDTEMASANVAIEALARPIDNDFAETLKKELPYDVCAAQMMAKIGKMISEDPGLKDSTSISGFTPADARAEANKLMADPYYGSEHPAGKERNVLKHQELVNQVNRLFEIANV